MLKYFFKGKFHTISYFSYNPTVSLCVDEGWIKQPHLAQSDWTRAGGDCTPVAH